MGDGRRGVLRDWAMVAVVLMALAVPPQGVDAYYVVKITEDGPSLPPSDGSSSMTFESSPEGTYYLITGYGEAGEFRVLDSDMSTVRVIEPPEDGFVMKGCTFSDWGARLLVWGRASGDDNDTVRFYDGDSDSYLDDLLVNVTVPLVTIDHARIIAGERVLLAAGRDVNGTSTVLFIEVATGTVISRHEVPGDRTVLHSDVNLNLLPVIDVRGGVLWIESSAWTLNGTEPPLGSILTVYEAHDKRNWDLGTEDGGVLVRSWSDGGSVHQHQLAGEPVQGTVSQTLEGGHKFVVTARPGEGGGSILEVWFAEKDPWKLVREDTTEKAVSFIHIVPGQDMGYIVGYEDGSVVQYIVDIKWVWPEEDAFYEDPAFYVISGTLVVLVILLAWWWRRGRGGSD